MASEQPRHIDAQQVEVTECVIQQLTSNRSNDFMVSVWIYLVTPRDDSIDECLLCVVTSDMADVDSHDVRLSLVGCYRDGRAARASRV